MKPSSDFGFFASYYTTVTYALHDDHALPEQTTEIPIHFPSQESSIPIPPDPHPPSESQSNAATKIQSAYRAHVIRTLYKTISAVNSEADRLQRLIQRQETVNAIRSSGREKVGMNEALMRLLLRLDSVPGINETVREARRAVSRRIVGLQEIVDAIAEAKIDGYCDRWWWDPVGGYSKNWDEVVAEMEEELCRERGGDELERFCAQHLGFRCLRRFLCEP